MKLLLRVFGWIFAVGTVLFLVGIAAAAGLFWHFSKDLPDYSQLQEYEPPVMTRVHASDGALVAEYARERRLYLPIQAIPKLVLNAFIAAEDKSFYEHGGLDFQGIARAGLLLVQNYGSGRRPQGASTITQQVAKHFLLTNNASGRSNAAITCSTAWSRIATSSSRKARRPRRIRSPSRRVRPARTSTRPNISPRKCAAT